MYVLILYLWSYGFSKTAVNIHSYNSEGECIKYGEKIEKTDMPGTVAGYRCFKVEEERK